MKGTALRTLRKQRGLTRRQLADFVGMSLERVGHIEYTQDAVVSGYELDRFAEALQVDRHVLSGFDHDSRETPEGVGANVKKLRIHRGMTQQGLARRAGLDKSFISQIEEHNKVDSLDTLYRLARALEVRPSVLMKDITTGEIQTILELLAEELRKSQMGKIICPHCKSVIRVK